MNQSISFYSFLVLLALSLKPQHGYGLTRQINSDTNQMLRLGPGTLYGLLKQLSSLHLIEQMPSVGDSRRIVYRLTRKGWATLQAEAPKYAALGSHIEQRRIEL